MKKINLIDKFSSFFKNQNQEDQENPIFKIQFEINDIKDISDLERGTVIIHKSARLYKIYDFGLFQFLDDWHQAVYYKEVFPTNAVDGSILYGRTFNELKESFKIVKNFDSGIFKMNLKNRFKKDTEKMGRILNEKNITDLRYRN